MCPASNGIKSLQTSNLRNVLTQIMHDRIFNQEVSHLSRHMKLGKSGLSNHRLSDMTVQSIGNILMFYINSLSQCNGIKY